MRSLDTSQSWYGAGNALIKPAHPYTQAGQAPSNFHLPLTPTPQQTANLNGGTFSVTHGPSAVSSITLPFASPNSFTTSPVDWGPSS